MTDAAGGEDPFDPRELDALWDFDDPAESEARFRERLAHMAPGTVSSAELETQLARALGLRGRFDEAAVVLEGVKHDHPTVLARAFLERGRLHNSAGDTAAARRYFHAAITHADSAGSDALAIDALREFEAALAVYAGTGTSMQVHIAHWAIARCLRSLGRYGEALAIQERLARDDPPDPFVDEEIALLREALGRGR